MNGKRSGEFAWIARHFAPLAGRGAHGLADDAALADLGRAIVTQDTIVEGVHFLPDDAPSAVAEKAIGVNASDIVAKGGTPVAITVGLGVPDRWGDADVAAFTEGLAEYCDPTLAASNGYPRLELLGGDTTRSPERLFVSLTMFGRPGERYVSRRGAQPGDAIVVCGQIGRGTLGLRMRRGELLADDRTVRHYTAPVPNFAASAAVARFASASMDVSDGLVGDLAKLCAVSGVRGVVDLADVPVPADAVPSIAERRDLLVDLATGGDDYVVLMTVPVRHRAALSAMEGVDATVIGRILAGKGVGVFLDGVPVTVERASYSHD